MGNSRLSLGIGGDEVQWVKVEGVRGFSPMKRLGEVVVQVVHLWSRAEGEEPLGSCGPFPHLACLSVWK